MATDGDGNHSRRRLLELVREVGAMTLKDNGGELVFKKDCMDLVRRVSLLTHFVEEITDLEGQDCNLEDGSDLVMAVEAAQSLLSVAAVFQIISNSDGATEKIALRFEIVTKKLEQALSKIPYDQFDISEEVQEQVGLVRRQLRRATERYGSVTSLQSIEKGVSQVQSGITSTGSENSKNGSISPEVSETSDSCSRSNSSEELNSEEASKKLGEGDNGVKDNVAWKGAKDVKKADTPKIPQDFLCPISLELMKDPVIVATGQTYERSYIQRWIDSGNVTCPKTQQKLENFTLTPNYVLRSLINQWCVDNNVEQPTVLANGRIKKSDGSLRDVSGDIETIQALVRKLSSQSIDERKYAVSEIRSLSKRSTDNRILIAEAGAIPILVNLLTSDDVSVQENAVTSILNLSIYENNKGLIMLAGAVPSIVQVLRGGGVEARENAAATLFSLSLADENKIIIGASGAIPALVDLLEHGTTRGKKDAATALFNLCIYQGNKGKAVRAGIITALLKMLTDSRNCMVDEALTILSVLASNQEAKVAIVKASTLPVLIELLRTGMPRNKENSAAILLSLCKRDPENLACIDRLGSVEPLTELSRNGTERAKRKATSLLEHIKKLQQH